MGKPPILNFSCSLRAPNCEKPFFYDDDSNLNYIKIGNSQTLFINAPSVTASELYTKTETDREADDDNMLTAELHTKTFVERESDNDHSIYLELLTKTKIDRESDDV